MRVCIHRPHVWLSAQFWERSEQVGTVDGVLGSGQAKILPLLCCFAASEGPHTELHLWASVSSSVNEDGHSGILGRLEVLRVCEVSGTEMKNNQLKQNSPSIFPSVRLCLTWEELDISTPRRTETCIQICGDLEHSPPHPRKFFQGLVVATSKQPAA